MNKRKKLYKFIKEYAKIPFRIVLKKLLLIRKPFETEFNLIDSIYKSKRALLWPDEFLQIAYCVQATEKLGGDIVEVGVAGGGLLR